MRLLNRIEHFRIVLAVILVAFDIAACASGLLAISEVMTENRTALADEDGDYPDWVEILNVSPSEVFLGDYFLSDDQTEPTKWALPSVSLAAGETFVVFCSGKDRRSVSKEAAAGFFDPISLSGLSFWVDASDPSSIVLQEGRVAFWLDKSGNERHASQIAEQKRPVYGSHGPGHLPVLHYDGNDDCLQFPELHQIRTVFWVGFEAPEASDSARPILGHERHFDFHRGGNRTLFAFKHTLPIQQGTTYVNGEIADPWKTPFPPSLSQITVTSPVDLRANLLASDRLVVDRIWQGGIAEVLLYDRVLSPNEIRQVHAYLEAKWELPTNYFHANFGLRSGAETVSLFGAAGNLVDAISVPEVSADISIGRSDFDSSAAGRLEYYVASTPGRANEPSGMIGQAPAPVLLVPAGAYEQALSVRVEEAPEGSQIRFTTDGSVPGENSPIWTGPLLLAETKTLRFRTFHDGHVPSASETASYFIADSSTLPRIALTTAPDHLFDPESGIYVKGAGASPQLPHFGANFWRDWERPVTVEYFSAAGQRLLAQDAGIKIHGGWSRAAPHKSLALIARNRYGSNRFELPVFDEKSLSSFKQWLLRNSGNDWVRTLFRDAVSQSLAGSLGLETQAYQPVHVFLNGDYWGIQNLRERLNEHFLTGNFGLASGDFDFLEGDRRIIAGEVESFDQMLFYLRDTSPLSPGFIEGVEGMMDLANFFDYMVTQIFIDNTDWPGNNIRYWRERSDEGRWRWIPFDLDGGFDILHAGADTNTLQDVLGFRNQSFRPSWIRYIFQRLLANPILEHRFLTRFQDLVNTTFSTPKVLALINGMEQRLEPEIERHIARWGGSDSLDFVSFDSKKQWEEYVGIAKAFALLRPDVVREHLQEAFGLNEWQGLTIAIPDASQAQLRVNGIVLPPQASLWQGKYAAGSRVTIEVEPRAGFRFAGWGDGVPAGPKREIVLETDAGFAALFEADSESVPFPSSSHALAQHPFVLQAVFDDAVQSQGELSWGVTGRSEVDGGMGELGVHPWDGWSSRTESSRIAPLGGDGVSFLNTPGRPHPGLGVGYVHSLIVGLDTTEVGSGTVSWQVETLEAGGVDYGLRLQYRLNPSLPFQDFPNVPEDELLFSAPGGTTGSKRFERIPMPLETLGQARVELRWSYERLGVSGGDGARPEIRLDDIVIAASGQSADLLDGDVVINEVMYHPSTRDPRDEFIELYNRGNRAVDLSGWRLSNAVGFEIESGMIPPGGFVVLAADRARFLERFPQVERVFGDWEGQLSNQSETIRLFNARDEQIDRVEYADEGDWAERVRGPLDHGYRGWIWSDAHDGGGYSVELRAPGLSNNIGSNWAASEQLWGSPGERNANFMENGAPLLSSVSHHPVIPRSNDTVTVRVRVRDEALQQVSVKLFYRSGSEGPFTNVVMWDDGRHGDEEDGDGVFAAQVPPHPNLSLISFFVQAMDAMGNESVWPRFDAESIEVAPLGLFQFDDQDYERGTPLLRVIMTEQERRELNQIGDLPWNASSDAQVNGTFISQQGTEVQVRYSIGFRLRGSTSRDSSVKNRRVNFRSDDRWKGKNALILNAVNVPSQIIGGLFFRLAGVPAAEARPVRFLENGINRANLGSPQFGHYAALEALDDLFVSRQFPDDDEGNLYRPSGAGNLEYLGEDPALYQRPGFYEKGTNREADEWSDLIELTRTLEQSSEESYVAAIETRVDLDRWIGYFAVDALLANFETSFANGGAGDYSLYIGESDPRAFLTAYDLDSVWLPNPVVVELPLFRAGANPVPNRFLKHPVIARRYHARLRELARTLFRSEELSSRLGYALGEWVEPGEIERLISVASMRRDFVLGASHVALEVDLDLPFAEPAWLRYYLGENDVLSLKGRSDPLETRVVTVNGSPASFEPWSGEWSIAAVPLHSGVNQIVIRSFNEVEENQSLIFQVYHPGEGLVISEGALSVDTIWSAQQSPIVLDQDLRVPEGITLNIEPGVSLEFNRGASLIVEGRLLARGTPDHRIFLSRNRRETTRWGGIHFNGASNMNELHYATIEWSGAPTMRVIDSTVSMIGLRWSGAFDSYLHCQNSSLLLKDSVLPNAVGGELITGFGVPVDGFWILEGNQFGTTGGGGDIVDFSGGRRPGSMLQILDNTFLGGPDDGLDLDGADAFVAGNTFMGFRKNNAGTGDAHAISTGLYEGKVSDLTLVRNVFTDNEHALLMKEGAVAVLENNTFVRSLLGTVNFSEVQRGTFPPDSISIHQSIVWDSPLFRHLDVAQNLNPDLVPVFERSLIFPAVESVSESNLELDPLFVDPIFDFRLQSESPAIGAGNHGEDLGAFVGPQLRISGEPPSLTNRTGAELSISGPGMDAYRYRLDGGDWSDAISIETLLVLKALSVGPHSVEVIGRNIAGRWQDFSEASASRTWFVNPGLSGVRINEVLASNVRGHSVEGEFPDYVELYNAGDQVVDLSRTQLSDDPEIPNKFVFPAGTILQPDEYLAVYADGAPEKMGLHAGFRISSQGGGVYLRERFSRGESILDSVEFGRQLSDLSLSRDAIGIWTLGEPTPLGSNRPIRMGSLDRVTINEWLASPLGEEADFVELYNSSAYPVDFGGASLSLEPTLSSKTRSFPRLSFINGLSFLTWYADNGIAGGAGELGFRLSDEQGMIGLLDSQGRAIDQVIYGYQMVGVSSERDPAGGATIRPNPTPTPGRGISSLNMMPEIFLSEVVADNRVSPGSEGTFPDWVELWNPGERAIDLEGLSLSDDIDRPDRWVFPEGAEIEAGGYFLIDFDPLRTAGAGNTGFGLKSDGDDVFLFRPNGTGWVLIDEVRFGLQAPGWSLGRVFESGEWVLSDLSPGEANRPVELGDRRSLRINEWMAQPDQGSDWFELYNGDDAPLALDGLLLSDDPLVIDRHRIAPLSFIGVDLFAYTVFEADGQPDRGGTHVDFKLSAGGELIGLYSAEGELIDGVEFSEQRRGVSEGRRPDGGMAIVAFPNRASLGKENFVDLDGDGMLDPWERRFGLDPSDANDGGRDSDGDGVINRMEYAAGTNPLDPASRFAIERLFLEEGSFGISFVGERGQGYRVEISQRLGLDGWRELREIKRLAETVSLRLNLGPVENEGFYRVTTW